MEATAVQTSIKSRAEAKNYVCLIGRVESPIGNDWMFLEHQRLKVHFIYIYFFPTIEQIFANKTKFVTRNLIEICSMKLKVGVVHTYKSIEMKTCKKTQFL